MMKSTSTFKLTGKHFFYQFFRKQRITLAILYILKFSIQSLINIVLICAYFTWDMKKEKWHCWARENYTVKNKVFLFQNFYACHFYFSTTCKQRSCMLQLFPFKHTFVMLHTRHIVQSNTILFVKKKKFLRKNIEI